MDRRQQPEDSGPDFRKWFTPRNAVIVVVVYLAVYAIVGVVLAFVYGGITNAGVFGDMFGALNAFVSGLAMLGVIAAILLQLDQNRMQAQELKDTREELKGQKEALETQNEQARRTSEAAIMAQLMVEYDSLRDSIRALQDFYAQFPDKNAALAAFRFGRINRTTPVTTVIDPSRFAISRFFVRIRKLSNGGYLSRRLVWLALGRAAIEDVFLGLVDPLDQVVNEIAGNPTSIADRDFFARLVADRDTLEANTIS